MREKTKMLSKLLIHVIILIVSYLINAHLCHHFRPHYFIDILKTNI